MNAVAEKLTGWPSAEARGKPLAKVFHIVNEQTRQACENPVEKVRRLKQVVGLANHTVLVGRDGREYVIDDSAAPIMSGAGKMIGVVLVFRDVTEERQVQAALVASEKLAVAGRLAASIAHEIHNPLDSVANLHYLLAQENDPAKREEFLRLAQQELGRTMQISRTMLSLYREPRAPIQIDLRELIEGVLLLLDRRAAAPGDSFGNEDCRRSVGGGLPRRTAAGVHQPHRERHRGVGVERQSAHHHGAGGAGGNARRRSGH